MIEALLEEVKEEADARNDEVLHAVLTSIGSALCDYCRYRRDYVEYKILAKQGRAQLRKYFRREATCPLEEYALVHGHVLNESRVEELFKVAWEFRHQMYKAGHCTCSSEIMSRKGNENVGPRSKSILFVGGGGQPGIIAIPFADS